MLLPCAGNGDYNDVGSLLNSMSTEYPATWFYKVDTDRAQVIKHSLICNFADTYINDSLALRLHLVLLIYLTGLVNSCVCAVMQEVADRCDVSSTPTLQVYKDAVLVRAAENPTADEVQDLCEEFGQKY